jgi:hypothetical protein
MLPRALRSSSLVRYQGSYCCISILRVLQDNMGLEIA